MTGPRPRGPLVPAVAPSRSATSSFGKSEAIRVRFEWASAAEIRSALDDFCRITGRSDRASVDALSRQQLHRHQVLAFRAVVPRLAVTRWDDDRGRALRIFDQAQALHGMLQERFDSTVALPPLVGDVFREAAEGLFTVGDVQFRRLKELAVSLADWVETKKFTSVVLVESPLGNSVPVQVLCDLCGTRGLPVKTVEWGFPRNDRAGKGRTLKDATAAFAKEPEVGAADCVLFVDDVLTGTRFNKLAEAMRKAVGVDRFAAVAMRFQFSPESGRTPYRRRNLDKVEAWGKAMGLIEPIVEFPALPLITIDGNGPVYFESAVAWTDQDIVAGKRKVNLLFETIDKYREIYDGLCTSGDPLRRDLESIWSEDTSGSRWAFAPGLVDTVFDKIGQRAAADLIFMRVRQAAIAAFPADHLGQRLPLTEPEVRRRTDWLHDCLRAPAEAELGESGGMVANAILALNHAGAGVPGRPRNRDHDYGHYTFAWRPEILTLNKRLRELILTA
jgi:hypothetical protein